MTYKISNIGKAGNKKPKVVESIEGDAIEGGSGSIDYYVGPNGKALPSQYKDWIGTNMQEELLGQAENPKLKNAIKELY